MYSGLLAAEDGKHVGLRRSLAIELEKRGHPALRLFPFSAVHQAAFHVRPQESSLDCPEGCSRCAEHWPLDTLPTLLRLAGASLTSL